MKTLLVKSRAGICLFIFAAALLLPASCGTCSMVSEPETITMSMADFQKLETNYKELLLVLEESQTALQEARQLLTASDEDLSELQNSLTSSRQKIQLLQLQLQTQQEMSKLLLNQLTQLQTESEMLQSQLQKAEKSLNDTEKAYQNERKINKRQARLWQVIAAIAAGFAVAR